MIVAVVTVHLSKRFFAQNGGYEYAFVLAVAALTLAFTGPGSLSLDAVLGLQRSCLRCCSFAGWSRERRYGHAGMAQSARSANRYQVN